MNKTERQIDWLMNPSDCESPYELEEQDLLNIIQAFYDYDHEHMELRKNLYSRIDKILDSAPPAKKR